MEYPIDVQLLDKFYDFVNDFPTEGQQNVWSRDALRDSYVVDPSVEWIDKRCTMRAIKYVKMLAVCFYNVEWSGERNDRTINRFSNLEAFMNDVFQCRDLARALEFSVFFIACLRKDAKEFFAVLEKLPHAIAVDEFSESVIEYVMNVQSHQEKKLQAGAGASFLCILNLAHQNDLSVVDSLKIDVTVPVETQLMQKLSLIKAQLFCTDIGTCFGTLGEALTFLTDQFFQMPSMHMTATEKLLLQLIPCFLKETAASLCVSSQVSEDMILKSSLAIFKLYKTQSVLFYFRNKSRYDTLHKRSTFMSFRDLLKNGQPVQLSCQLSSETELNLEELIAVYDHGSFSLFHDFIKSDRVLYADHLIQKLRKLLTNKPHTFSLMTDQLIALLGDLELLGSFLTDAKNKDVELRVLCLLYEVEYIIDMFLCGDSPAWYQQLLIFNAIEDTNQIKAQMVDMGSFELASTDDQAKHIGDLLHNESKHPEKIYYFLKEFEDGGAREYWRNHVYTSYVLNPSAHWTDEKSTLRATKFLKTIQYFYNTKHGGNGIDEDEQMALQCDKRKTYLKWLCHEIHHEFEEDPHRLASALSESLDAVGLLRVKFADTCNQLMKVPVPARFNDGDMFSDLVDSVQHNLMQSNYKLTVQMLEQFRYLVCRFSKMCTNQNRLQSLLPPAVTVVSIIQEMAYTGEMEENMFPSASDMNVRVTGSRSFLNLLQAAQKHSRVVGAILDFPIMDLVGSEPDDHSELAETLLKKGYTAVAKETLAFELILSFLRDTTSLEMVSCALEEDGTLATSAVMNKMTSPRKIEKIAAVYMRDLLCLFNNFPRTDGFFFAEHLLKKLKMFATSMPDTDAFMKDQFQAFLKNLEFFVSFLNDSKNKDVGLCVTFFIYAAEYIVDMFILGDGPLCYHQLVLFIAIREVEFIKAQILDCSNDNDSSELPLQDDQLTLDNDALKGRHLNTEEVVVGFDDHVKNIVELLETGSKNLQVFSIVGMAGIGKTTLAKKVYSLLLSKGRFAAYAGSSVSQVYRKRELLLEILADFSAVTSAVKNMDDNDLAQMVFRSLKGKRDLILLDDIWRIEHWSDLRLSFPDDKKGSRILFTTRVRSVAEEANNTNPKIEPYFLPLLSLEQSWDLLKEKVFSGGSCPEKLHEVGRLVAEHCKGLPLAIVVMAGILKKVQEQKDKWEEVARHLRSRVADDEETQFMSILELSYNHLPSHLKPCFLYLGSFLEDQEIPVKKLQWLWMGEGFIPRMDEKSLEVMAGAYMVELINRSLIMESKRCCLGGVKTCRIHDMLRDLCLKKAKEENFMQLISMDGSNESESPVNMQYRVCVHSSKQSFIQLKPSSSHVHSILFFATNNSQDKKMFDISSILQDYKLVRVLDLEPITASIFPSGADLLSCLNYLAIKGDINSVPSSISKLRNLEILIVRGIHGEIALPSTIWSMVTLRHVHVRPRASFTSPSPELENATIFPNLISFSCPVVSDWNEVKKILKRLIGLKSLRCDFLELKYWDSDRKRFVFPAMQFLTQLECLNVSYVGNTFPCEFSFPLNLMKLTLSGFCFSWDYMSVIIQLSKLEVLKLLFRAVDGNTWDMTEETIFPELKYLKFGNLNIAKWNNSMDCSDHFPALERLVLRGCRKLVEVPSSFGEVPTLQMIEMQLCSQAAEHSVRDIFEQQLEYGNKDFKVMITPSQSIAQRFR